MKKGLVMGRFDPLHNGHVGLVEFALSHCEKLTLLLCTSRADQTPENIRVKWLKETFAKNKNIQIAVLFFNVTESGKNEIPQWAENIRKLGIQTDIIFSSESYGDELAKQLHGRHLMYDLLRTKNNITATQIRQNPIEHINSIVDAAKSYFQNKHSDLFVRR